MRRGSTTSTNTMMRKDDNTYLPNEGVASAEGLSQQRAKKFEPRLKESFREDKSGRILVVRVSLVETDTWDGRC